MPSRNAASVTPFLRVTSTTVPMRQGQQDPSSLYVQNGELSFPKKLVKALSITQLSLAAAILVPHFCIVAMDKLGWVDVAAGIWSCVLYMTAGTLGLWLSKRAALVSRTPIAFHIVALVVATAFNMTLIVKSALGRFLGHTQYYTEWGEANENLEAVYRVLVACFLAEAVLSVCAAVISSRAACCPQAPVYILEMGNSPAAAVSGQVGGGVVEAPPPKYEDIFSSGSGNSGGSKLAY